MSSDTAAYFGRNDQARKLSRRAIDAAKREADKQNAALWQVRLALREAELGNGTEARQQAQAARALASSYDSRIVAAMALARAGDLPAASKMAEELAKHYPQDFLAARYCRPSISAAIEMRRGKSDNAIEILQTAAPHELGSVGPLDPAYIRSERLLELRQRKEAAAEFQKLLDNRGVVLNNILVPLVHLGLARAHVLQGETDKAKTAYQDFFQDLERRRPRHTRPEASHGRVRSWDFRFETR